jgi:hypothetical protein
MIETTDIYRTLKELLETNFDITVQIKDKKTPVPPCFYIEFVAEKESQTATEFNNNQCSFDLVYFSKEETLLDLLTVKKKLQKLLKKPLKITLLDDNKTVQYQEIDDVEYNLNEEDYVLNCIISLNINQSTGSTPSYKGVDYDNRYDEFESDEVMEELEI